MRVLYFTFITPSSKFGGGIGVIQSLVGLSANSEVDYIGPEIDELDTKNYDLNFNVISTLEPCKSVGKRIKNFIRYGVTTSFFDSWKQAVNAVDVSRYDCVYLDFSRQDFVVKWAKNNGLPIIVRVHNVEYEYFNTLYHNSKKIADLIRSKLMYKKERYCIENADKVLVLTQHDKECICEIYGMDNNEKISIMPVCIRRESCNTSIDNEKPYILLAGSLWFGPNADGVKWFLEKVWNQLESEIGERYELYVVGANPNDEIKKLVAKYKKIHLFDSPKDIRPFYKNAEIFVAPIFYGAGMKVKVAEALESLLFVVGTSHALIGYESVKDVTYEVNTEKEFISIIRMLVNQSKDYKSKVKLRINELFQENYSMEQCQRIIGESLSEVAQK